MTYFFSKKPEEEAMLVGFFRKKNKETKMILQIAAERAAFIFHQKGTKEEVKSITNQACMILWEKMKEKTKLLLLQLDYKHKFSEREAKALKFDLTGKIDSYLFIIIRNLWYDLNRKRGRNISLDNPDYPLEPSDLVTPESLLIKEEEESNRIELEKIAKEEFDKLNEKCQKLLKESLFKSHKELAKDLGDAPASIRVMKHRCMKKLIKAIKRRLNQ